MDAKRSLGGIV